MYQQCMTSPLRDAQLVEDAASGASVHNQPQVNRKCAACNLCGKRVYNSGATVKPIITTYMHIVSMEGSVMIMNGSQNKPQTRMQLTQSPANGTPSPERQRIQKSYSLLLRIRIKLQQLRRLMMSETFLDEKRLSAWTKRS